MREGVLHVKLAAAPVEGAANAALIDLLSRQLRLPKRSLRIATGELSRTKTVEIAGLTEVEVHARLAVRPNQSSALRTPSSLVLRSGILHLWWSTS
jgi:uncharacterized protein YggU (UPF0235/DUF167 family)